VQKQKKTATEQFAKQFAKQQQTKSMRKRDPGSLKATMHYSFDDAQQVHISSKSMQDGPIYFKTPRKSGIFGVLCEGIQQKVNFLIDESVNESVGKGGNATISYVHYYLSNHGL
jgi:hypothetical protein